MFDLHWSWLCAPYVACTIAVLAVALAAALVRGDRVLRLGVISAAFSAAPWTVCQALAACTHDPEVATRLLRLGNAPIALVGPNLLLVLLGVSGQLERYRWLARMSGVIGTVFTVACWATPWTVPGVQQLSSGMFYVQPGPLTTIHLSLLVGWLGVGLVIVGRSTPRGERRRIVRMMIGVLVLGAVGSSDTLLLYHQGGSYPIAWLAALITASLTLYLVLATDLLRPQGLDLGLAIEVGGFGAIIVAVVGIALALPDASPVVLAGLGASAWTIVTGVAWTIGRRRPARVAGERELEQFVARVAEVDDAAAIAERLAALWKRSIGIDVRATWWTDAGELVSNGQRWQLAPQLVAWFVRSSEALAVTDLATMRLGANRGPLEALAAERGVDLFVPLVDRGELVGLVEAMYDRALREGERGLIIESARAGARAMTFIGLARSAARERETAREVEVADALRLQASASRDAELGRWAVMVEYRTAKRGGAGWSATELGDGRLALLVTESQAHGVAAALATAAVTGAFAAATTGASGLRLDELLAAMQASADGVMRGGEPVAAFLAILDAEQQLIEWACAGHPGAALVGPIDVDAEFPVGSARGGPRPRPIAIGPGAGGDHTGASLSIATRGRTGYPPDTLVVVASTGLRGTDDARWLETLREIAPAAGRLASVVVETALRAGPPSEDLLAVVVRRR